MAKREKWTQAEIDEVVAIAAELADVASDVDDTQPAAPDAGGLEDQCRADLEAANDDMRKTQSRQFDAEKQFHAQNRADFWSCIVFQTAAQREEFFTKMELQDFIGQKYIDGREFAVRFGLKLDTPDLVERPMRATI